MIPFFGTWKAASIMYSLGCPRARKPKKGFFGVSLNPKLRHGRLHPSLKIGPPPKRKGSSSNHSITQVFLLLQNKQTSVFCGSLKWGSTFFKGCLCVLCELFGGYTVASDFTVPVGNLESRCSAINSRRILIYHLSEWGQYFDENTRIHQIKWIESKKMWLS